MESVTENKTTWAVDPMHSEVQFKVKHLVISTVTGNFNQYNGEVITEGDNFANAQVTFTIDTDSISTNNEQRDGHLKSDDFFAADKYPQITFKSTAVEKTGVDTFKLTGDLTIRDVTKPVTLEVEQGGIARDMYGNTKAGFEVSGKINRKEFGLQWNGITEAGSVVVSDEVKIIASVQFARQ